MDGRMDGWITEHPSVYSLHLLWETAPSSVATLSMLDEKRGRVFVRRQLGMRRAGGSIGCLAMWYRDYSVCLLPTSCS